MGEERGWSLALLSGTQWQDKRQWAKLETQEIAFKHNKKLFYCESDWALAQVAQSGHGVSIHADTQNPDGHSPE